MLKIIVLLLALVQISGYVFASKAEAVILNGVPMLCVNNNGLMDCV